MPKTLLEICGPDITCGLSIQLGHELHDFMVNVPSVNEESITDYLLWRWRQIDNRFRYLSRPGPSLRIRTKAYNKQEESTITGADFLLELWLIKDNGLFALLVQAKKFIKNYDKYASKFRYPSGTSKQIDKLKAYAGEKNYWPVYFIYSTNEVKAQSRCKYYSRHSGAFVLQHCAAKRFSKKLKEPLSLKKIITTSFPLHCLFCRPWLSVHEKLLGVSSPGKAVKLPKYISNLLSGDLESFHEVWPVEEPSIKWIAAYDLRGKE